MEKLVSAVPCGGRREILWCEFFQDPSQWWDHRTEKVTARYPDFKHKKTQDALWVDDCRNPPWIAAKMAVMVPGTVALSPFGWNKRLERFAKAGQPEKVMQLFQQMQQEGTTPDPFTFVQVLNACASLRALELGRHVHEQILQIGCESNVFVGNSLVDMYAKCGNLEEASRVFNKMPSRDIVSWNSIIMGHVKCGHEYGALDLFRQMQQEGFQPNSVTFLGVLNACASVGTLEEGRRAHEQITQSGCESNVFVGNSLVDMYAKCGSMEEAWRVFNRIPSRDVVSWNIIIFGFVKCGQGQKALDLFRLMQQEGLQPNSLTFVGVLNACASVGALEDGRHAHQQIIHKGWESDFCVRSSLVDMYAKCGSMDEASRVFNKMPAYDVVSCTAMIFGHIKHGQVCEALDLFRLMQQEGLKPDRITFVGLLNACATVGALEEGRRAHEQIIQSGWESDVFVGNSLVDMYAKCARMDDAWRVFNKMPSRSPVSWNVMILGLVKCGEGQKALELYRQMQQEGLQPDTVTFVGVLNACASMVALDEGKYAHEHIVQSGYNTDVFVGNSLIDMYAKCGSMEDARRVFNEMPSRNVVSWTTMLQGFAMHGHGKDALEHFQQMCEEGVKPDTVTFLCLLSACRHAGLVDEGLRCFHSMRTNYLISAKLEHYSCMVDLLGRAGRLHEAEDMIKGMPCEPNATVWLALLGACRIHGNVEMGERVAKHVLEMDPGNAAAIEQLHCCWQVES